MHGTPDANAASQSSAAGVGGSGSSGCGPSAGGVSAVGSCGLGSSVSVIGGSVSAEHGVGLEKKPYLDISRSEAEIELMRALKRALDPKGLLNPGKIFDAGPATGQEAA